ncbi:hypothetical protein AX14_010005 [Amanita brunnescens Koide BX004]|nr:hypothetical protein AX14_010005 [Amanita brunnescens Koide BX004]
MQILNEQVRFSAFPTTPPHPSRFSQRQPKNAPKTRGSSFVGALALGDLVKSTLGPKGMNKILQSGSSGDINVTNDGATILKAIQFDNAAAKILVKTMKWATARRARLWRGIGSGSFGGSEEVREDLVNIAKTTLSSKVLAQDNNYFANLVVDAVLRLKVRVLDLRNSSISRSSKKSEAS